MTLTPDYTISGNGLPNILNEKLKKCANGTNNHYAQISPYQQNNNKLLNKRATSTTTATTTMRSAPATVTTDELYSWSSIITNDGDNRFSTSTNGVGTAASMEFCSRRRRQVIDKATKDMYNQRLKDYEIFNSHR